MRHVRTRITEDDYEAMEGKAALAGVSIAEWVRRLIHDAVSDRSDTPGRPKPTGEERAQWSAWLNACTDVPDKGAWLAAVDAELRKRGVDLPPYGPTPEEKFAWAAAVHPHTRASGTDITPPRWY